MPDEHNGSRLRGQRAETMQNPSRVGVWNQMSRFAQRSHHVGITKGEVVTAQPAEQATWCNALMDPSCVPKLGEAPGDDDRLDVVVEVVRVVLGAALYLPRVAEQACEQRSCVRVAGRGKQPAQP